MADLLPDEITIDIFSRLPAESLVPFKLVCKSWRRVLRSTIFADTHLRRQLQKQQQQELYHQDNDHVDDFAVGSSRNVGGPGNGGGGGTSKVSFLFLGYCPIPNDKKCSYKSIFYGEYDYDKCSFYHKTSRRSLINEDRSDAVDCWKLKSIIGSCNGLICFSLRSQNSYISGNDPVYILNPITGEEVNLPKYINNYQSNNGVFQYVGMASGFGYVCSTNEYKVVRISYMKDVLCDKFEVYTLGGNSGWRTKGKINSVRPKLSGMHLNGVLYWSAYTSEYEKSRRILAFDLGHEEFIDLPLLPFSEWEFFDLQLKVLGGCLCVFQHRFGGGPDIWLLKMNSRNGMKEQDYEWSLSWSLDLSFVPETSRPHSLYKLSALTNSGGLLLWYFSRLLLYDQETRTVKDLIQDEFGLSVCESISHMNTFVSLKDSGERLI